MKEDRIRIVILAFILIPLISLALPPQLSPLPDIFIGDLEDFGTYDLKLYQITTPDLLTIPTATSDGSTPAQSSWTEDLNIFRFPSAFNFDDYVDDPDTSDSALIWSFWEGDSVDSLMINGIRQLSSPAEAIDGAGGTKNLRAVSAEASFWDILASPPEQSPPYPTPTSDKLCNQIITLFVSDGTDVASRQIYVKSTDNTYDFKVPQPTTTNQWSMPATPPWVYTGVSGTTADGTPFYAASSGIGSNYISIHGSTNDARFGFWYSTIPIPNLPNKLYQIKWRIATDQINHYRVPVVRLRVNTTDFAQASAQVINPTGSTYFISQSPKVFYTYFYPSVSSGFYPSFDVYDFDLQQEGEVVLFEVEVNAYDYPGSGWVTQKTYDSTLDFFDWQFFSVPAVFSPVLSGAGYGKLMLASTGPAANHYGGWQSPTNDLDWVPERLYRITFNLSVNNNLQRYTAPFVRLRIGSEDHALYDMIILNSHPNTGGAMPYAGGTDYYVFVDSPPLPQNMNELNDGFALFFEMGDFDVTQYGQVNLERVVIQHRPRYFR